MYFLNFFMKRAISSLSHSEVSSSSSSSSYFSLELVLALLICLKSNFLLPCGSDTLGEVLDMIDFFDVHLIVHDPIKHIIG
jgi:hypothetical protein